VAPYTQKEVLAVILIPWDAQHQEQVKTIAWALGRVVAARGSADGLRDAVGTLLEWVAGRR